MPEEYNCTTETIWVRTECLGQQHCNSETQYWTFIKQQEQTTVVFLLILKNRHQYWFYSYCSQLVDGDDGRFVAGFIE